MILNVMLLVAGGLSAIALYLMMAVLVTLSMENELPDLEDVQV